MPLDEGGTLGLSSYASLSTNPGAGVCKTQLLCRSWARMCIPVRRFAELEHGAYFWKNNSV